MAWRRIVILTGAIVAVATACSIATSLDDLKGDGGGVDAAFDVPVLDASGDADADVSTGPVVDGSFAFASDWPTFSTTATGAASIAPLPGGGYVIGGDYSTSNAVVGAYLLPPATGTRDAYVVTLDANGNPTAALGFGGSGADEVLSVAVDPAGFVYVIGIVGSGGSLNGSTLTAGTFIAKLNTKNLASPPAWVRSFEISVACASCLTVSGGLLTAGVSFFGTIHYDSTQSVTSNGGLDVLLLELNTADGTPSWAGQIGGTGDDVVDGLARDAAGALYVVGDYTSTTLMAGQALGTMTPTGPGTKQNLLVAKLNASHAPVYAKAYGDPGGTTIAGGGIAPDNAGHVAVGGTFFGGVDFGMGPIGASSSNSIVFVLDEAQNKTVWQEPIAPSTNQLSALAFDPWGHLLATGSFDGNIKIGNATLSTSQGSVGAYIAKFGPSGTYGVEWAAGLPGVGDAGPAVLTSGLTIAPNGTVVVSGALEGKGYLGEGPVTSISPQDSFVAGRTP